MELTSLMIIQAENYSAMIGVQVEPTTDTDGGQNVRYLNPGNWMSHNNVMFPTLGTYTIEYRMATGASNGQFTAELNDGASAPGTGGWQNWTTVSHRKCQCGNLYA